jgi:2-dehydro-3-deoxyphosphogluconate aldolase/(4S)-4-hydroxy-2-oxoglutarate aldolase
MKKDSRHSILQAILDCGVVAIIRMVDSTKLIRVVEAIHAGGITAIEITLNTPDSLRMIETLSRSIGKEIQLGAGSVLDAEAARKAMDAGATYLVSPVFKPEIIHAAHRRGFPAMPGCFTPTEILAAHEAGADIVKVFPSDALGIPFFKAVLAPMPHLRLMPTGGISFANAGEWIKAGASCVGAGGALFDKRAVAEDDFVRITENARRLKQAVDQARKG